MIQAYVNTKESLHDIKLYTVPNSGHLLLVFNSEYEKLSGNTITNYPFYTLTTKRFM